MPSASDRAQDSFPVWRWPRWCRSSSGIAVTTPPEAGRCTCSRTHPRKISGSKFPARSIRGRGDLGPPCRRPAAVSSPRPARLASTPPASTCGMTSASHLARSAPPVGRVAPPRRAAARSPRHARAAGAARTSVGRVEVLGRYVELARAPRAGRVHCRKRRSDLGLRPSSGPDHPQADVLAGLHAQTRHRLDPAHVVLHGLGGSDHEHHWSLREADARRRRPAGMRPGAGLARPRREPSDATAEAAWSDRVRTRSRASERCAVPATGSRRRTSCRTDRVGRTTITSCTTSRCLRARPRKPMLVGDTSRSTSGTARDACQRSQRASATALRSGPRPPRLPVATPRCTSASRPRSASTSARVAVAEPEVPCR